MIESKFSAFPNPDEIYNRAIDAPMGKIRDTEMKIASNTIHIKDTIEKLTQLEIKVGSLKILSEVNSISQMANAR